jgi:hypothetical protein
MNLVQLRRALRPFRALGRFPIGLFVVMLMSAMVIADGPTAF